MAALYIRDENGNFAPVETIRGERGITGLPGRDGADGYSSGNNLLDNWYFECPVNQRGITTAEGGFFIDRWLGNGCSVGSDGLECNASGYIIQRLNDKQKAAMDGKTVCATVLYADGLISTGYGVYSRNPSNWIVLVKDSRVSFSVYPNNDSSYAGIAITFRTTATVVAVKLELGTEQTLAKMVDGVYVLNEIPDYDDMLLRCQRYYVRLPLLLVRATAVDSGNLYFDFPVPAPILHGATIAIESSELSLKSVGTYTDITTGFTFNVIRKSGDTYGINYVRIHAIKSGHGLSDATLRIGPGTAITVGM